MKKIILIVLYVALCLTSCMSPTLTDDGQGENIVDKENLLFYTPLVIGDDNSYSVCLVSNSEANVFKKALTNVSQGKDWTAVELNEDDMSIQIGNKIFDNLKHTQKRIRDSYEEWNIYQTADEKMVIQKDKYSKSFLMQSNGTASLAEYKEEVLTESKLIDYIERYVKSFTENVDFEAYEYACYTNVVTVNPLSAWSETKHEFYISQNPSEEVRTYRVEYVKFVNGVATSDKIIIFCDSKGNITNLYFYLYEADWDKCQVDQHLIDTTVSNFLNQEINNQYELKAYDVRSTTLIANGDGKIRISLAVEMTLTNGENEFASLCTLILE